MDLKVIYTQSKIIRCFAVKRKAELEFIVKMFELSIRAQHKKHTIARAEDFHNVFDVSV